MKDRTLRNGCQQPNPEYLNELWNMYQEACDVCADPTMVCSCLDETSARQETHSSESKTEAGSSEGLHSGLQADHKYPEVAVNT